MEVLTTKVIDMRDLVGARAPLIPLQDSYYTYESVPTLPEPASGLGPNLTLMTLFDALMEVLLTTKVIDMRVLLEDEDSSDTNPSSSDTLARLTLYT